MLYWSKPIKTNVQLPLETEDKDIQYVSLNALAY